MLDLLNENICVDKIITACFVPAGTGDSVFNNRHSHGLALNIGGKKDYCFGDGKILSVCGGDMIYLPKHSNYVVKTSILGDCYCINFDIPEDKGGEPFVFKVKNLSSYVDRYKRAVPVWIRKNAGHEAFVKAQLYNIISMLQGEYFSDYATSTRLNKILPAVQYIKEHYLSEIISIEALADMCGMTSVYFRKIFKIQFGLSPISYINSLKIARAKELLDSGMYSVSEAAFASGYSDISHFSREFKKAVGIAPSEYKKC